MKKNNLLIVTILSILTCQFISPAIAADVWLSETSPASSYSLAIEGEIAKGDLEKLELVLRQNGPLVYDLFLFSNGGDALEAMRIGDFIRSLGISTHAPDLDAEVYVKEGKKVQANCSSNLREQPKDIKNCACDSACFLIWIAGLERRGEYVGIHRPVFDGSLYSSMTPAEAERLYESMANNVRSYLMKYDVPEVTIEQMFNTPSQSIVGVNAMNFSRFPAYYQERLTAICGAPGGRGDSNAQNNQEIMSCRNTQYLIKDRIQFFGVVFGTDYVDSWLAKIQESSNQE